MGDEGLAVVFPGGQHRLEFRQSADLRIRPRTARPVPAGAIDPHGVKAGVLAAQYVMFGIVADMNDLIGPRV